MGLGSTIIHGLVESQAVIPDWMVPLAELCVQGELKQSFAVEQGVKPRYEIRWIMDCSRIWGGAAGWTSSPYRPMAVLYCLQGNCLGSSVRRGLQDTLLHLGGTRDYALQLGWVAVWDSSLGRTTGCVLTLDLVTAELPTWAMSQVVLSNRARSLCWTDCMLGSSAGWNPTLLQGYPGLLLRLPSCTVVLAWSPANCGCRMGSAAAQRSSVRLPVGAGLGSRLSHWAGPQFCFPACVKMESTLCSQYGL